MHWYLEVLKKYAVFSGRARRKEYWCFVLFNVIIAFLLEFIDAVAGLVGEIGFGPLGGLYTLAVLIPLIAVSVRRLHDTGCTGWWLLIGLVPLIGPILLLFSLVGDSEQGQNRYGPNPKEVAARPT
jgi:uncharacterized membrane protein YhaH (DUF805 family)